MKLYHNSEPEGWQIPGKQDRKATRVDVPSSPADLAAWLNARDVSPLADPRPVATQLEKLEEAIEQAESLEAAIARAGTYRPRVHGFCDACGQSSAGKLKLSQGADLETVISWLESAEDWQRERLAAVLQELGQ